MMVGIMIAYQWILLIFDIIQLHLRYVVLTIETVWDMIYPPKMKSVAGDIVLVTGAGHGIGRELSLQLARLGAKIVCWDISEETNKKIVTDIRKEGGVAWAFKCDVSSFEDVKAVSQKVREQIGDITILINNAGIMPCKPFLKHTPEEIEKLYKVNVLAHFWTIKEWLPTFIEAGKGHIVCLSSIAGMVGTPNIVPYCSSKFAVRGLMEGLIEELRYANRHPNIKLTAAHPFTVNTGLAKKPRIRFPNFSPVVPAEKCAQTIIEAMRRNEEVVCIPRRDYYMHVFRYFFPRKCQQAFADFMDTGVDEDDS